MSEEVGPGIRQILESNKLRAYTNRLSEREMEISVAFSPPTKRSGAPPEAGINDRVVLPGCPAENTMLPPSEVQSKPQIHC
jgi:hypothetical protein